MKLFVKGFGLMQRWEPVKEAPYGYCLSTCSWNLKWTGSAVVITGCKMGKQGQVGTPTGMSWTHEAALKSVTALTASRGTVSCRRTWRHMSQS